MTTTSLLDHLQEQGYDPEGLILGADIYDLTASGTGTVRLCLHPDDEYRAEVHFLDRYLVEEWSVSLSPGTPDAIILATLEAAEWQLAGRRGGPVTPAQAARA